MSIYQRNHNKALKALFVFNAANEELSVRKTESFFTLVVSFSRREGKLEKKKVIKIYYSPPSLFLSCRGFLSKNLQQKFPSIYSIIPR
jgi:hypothetical protein